MPTMKFGDLIKSYSWLSIEIVFMQNYPDEKKNISGYEKVFNTLRILTPIDSDITILVSNVKDDYDNLEHIDVSGYYTDTGKSGNDLTDSLALELTPWEKWLGMDIDKQSLHDFTTLELISHCLFEMTFFGFDQEGIQEEVIKINDIVEEIKNMPEAEKELKLISMDEVTKQVIKKNKKR